MTCGPFAKHLAALDLRAGDVTSEDVISRAWKRKMLQYHPDKRGDGYNGVAQQINAAKEFLMAYFQKKRAFACHADEAEDEEEGDNCYDDDDDCDDYDDDEDCEDDDEDDDDDFGGGEKTAMNEEEGDVYGSSNDKNNNNNNNDDHDKEQRRPRRPSTHPQQKKRSSSSSSSSQKKKKKRKAAGKEGEGGARTKKKKKRAAGGFQQEQQRAADTKTRPAAPRVPSTPSTITREEYEKSPIFLLRRIARARKEKVEEAAEKRRAQHRDEMMTTTMMRAAQHLSQHEKKEQHAAAKIQKDVQALKDRYRRRAEQIHAMEKVLRDYISSGNEDSSLLRTKFFSTESVFVLDEGWSSLFHQQLTQGGFKAEDVSVFLRSIVKQKRVLSNLFRH